MLSRTHRSASCFCTGSRGVGRRRLRKRGSHKPGTMQFGCTHADCAAAVDGSLFGVRLPELVLAHPASVAIVVDGLDREFQTDAFVALAELIRGIRDADDSDVRVVVTTQTHEWPRIGAGLQDRNAGATWSEVSVSPLEDAEIGELLRDTPEPATRLSPESRDECVQESEDAGHRRSIRGDRIPRERGVERVRCCGICSGTRSSAAKVSGGPAASRQSCRSLRPWRTESWRTSHSIR